jgi:flagellar hook protein FlgE
MMTQAYYTGISGLRTTSAGIDIVSDNLANANTVGFVGSNYEFSSLFENSLDDASNVVTSDSIGLGSTLQATPMIQSSGSIMNTQNSTDLAIVGDGWFGVQNVNNTISYTRDGAFTFDVNNDLVTMDGEYVLGTKANNISSNDTLTSVVSTVVLGDSNAQETLRFPKNLTYPAKPTTNVDLAGNIGTDNELRTMGAKLIDSNGDQNQLKVEYAQSEKQPETGIVWDVVSTVTSPDGTILDTQKGTLTFNESGALVNSTLTSVNNNGTQVALNFGKDYSGVVGIANSEITASTISDGKVSGELAGYAVDQNGEVIATFTNGEQSSVGKIALYHFQNDQGLERLSGTQFAASANSGKAFLYKDANGNNINGSELMNYSLENSNIDMTDSLTELIVLQRSYDSSSKVITTADEMIQKALDMDA